MIYGEEDPTGRSTDRCYKSRSSGDILAFMTQTKDTEELKAAFYALEERFNFCLSKEVIALLIIKVFNDLISQLAGYSAQRIASYASVLVRELPSRARLFSLGIPKLDNVNKSEKLFLLQTESLSQSFMRNHPLTSELRKHITQYQQYLTCDPTPSNVKTRLSQKSESSPDLMSAPVPLLSTSCMMPSRQYKRSFQIAFPATPKWMLTPCEDCSPTQSFDGSGNVLNNSSLNVKNVLPLFSPGIRGTPGFYSLCRRFGNMREKSFGQALRDLDDQSMLKGSALSYKIRYSEEKSASSKHKHNNTNLFSFRKTQNILQPTVFHCQIRGESTSFSSKKIGDPSWSPHPRIVSLNSGQMDHLECESTFTQEQTRNTAENLPIQQTKDNSDNDTEQKPDIRSTPKSQLTRVLTSAETGTVHQEFPYEAGEGTSYGQQTNVVETFGATPIPVRKSLTSNLQEIRESLISPTDKSPLAVSRNRHLHHDVSFRPALQNHSNGEIEPVFPFGTSVKKERIPRYFDSSSLHDLSKSQETSACDALQHTETQESSTHICFNNGNNSSRDKKTALAFSKNAHFVQHNLQEPNLLHLQHDLDIEKTKVRVVVEAEDDHPSDGSNLTVNSYLRNSICDQKDPQEQQTFKRHRDLASVSFGKPSSLVYSRVQLEPTKAPSGAVANVLSVHFRESLKSVASSCTSSSSSSSSSRSFFLNESHGQQSLSHSKIGNSTTLLRNQYSVNQEKQVTTEPEAIIKYNDSVQEEDQGNQLEPDCNPLYPCLAHSQLVSKEISNQLESFHNGTDYIETKNDQAVTLENPRKSHADVKRMTPRLHFREKRMHRTLRKIPPKDYEDQADLSGEDDNPKVKKTGKKEASWAKNTNEWFLIVKKQLDIDPLSIFGCGVRPVIFEDIFRTPDFHRAAKDMLKHNERLRQRAPDLLCEEAKIKQAQKWYQDQKLCGFKKNEGISQEDVVKFKTRVGRLKDISSLVWESKWTACDETCEHNSALRQPWFCKTFSEVSPSCSGNTNRIPLYNQSGTRRFMSPLPLNQANLPGVEEAADESLDASTACNTPEGYTRGIFCTTGPSTASKILKMGSTTSISGGNRSVSITHPGGLHIKRKLGCMSSSQLIKALNNGMRPDQEMSHHTFHTANTLSLKNQAFRLPGKQSQIASLRNISPFHSKNTTLSLFSKCKGKN